MAVSFEGGKRSDFAMAVELSRYHRNPTDLQALSDAPILGAMYFLESERNLEEMIGATKSNYD